MQRDQDWENTFDAITDMVILLDDQHRIIRVNKSAAKALNTTKSELIGKKCYDAVHGLSHPIPHCPLVATMRSLEPETREIVEPRIGGTFLCAASPILNQDGEISGFTHTLKDITKSKQLEDQPYQAQKMKAVGTLAGGIAHDFNNLLMGIQGRVSLISMDMDPGDPHLDHVKEIEEIVKMGADLTRQLLGFARGGKYEVKATDINGLIEKCSTMFGRTRKEIRINNRYKEGVWTVEVDRGQIEQVLLNLFVNAWQAMPEGGEIYIQTDNVTLDETYTRPPGVDPGDFVKISVTDTGAGMDKATRQRIFEPFFTTKGMGRGTGLGLASAYGIVRGHAGIISVYSKEGRGTTFNIYLPASKKEVDLDRDLEEEVLTGHETVLLVDDEELIV